jgi:hypothetical protein
LRAGAHERAILVVDGALLDHLLDVLGADRLAEDVRRECDIAQLRHHLCVLAGQIRHAVAPVQQQDAWTLAADRVVVGEVTFERGVAVLVVHALGSELGCCRDCLHDSEQGGCENNGRGAGAFHVIAPRVSDKSLSRRRRPVQPITAFPPWQWLRYL